MKVVGYIRVSTVSQGEAYGVEAQREAIERYCQSRGHEIIGWYEDKISGTAERRPQLDKLLYQRGNPPIEGVVVGRSDRIARDISLYYAIKHQMKTRGMQLISVAEDFGVNNAYVAMLEAVLAAMAEIERGAIKERTMAGRSVKAAHGGYAGGKQPYGYWVRDGELVIDEAEAAMVRYIYAMRDKKVSLRNIVKILAEEGYKTRKGTNFSLGGVVSILDHRKLYEGFYHYGNGTWVKGKQEPILDVDR